MTCTTEQIYDMEADGKSVYDFLQNQLLKGEPVIIQLPIPGEPSKDVERLASMDDLEAWQQRYQDAESKLKSMYNL